MKTAGDILSALFDERFMKKARGYSKLFDSWTDITAKNGIASAADHSRIKELDRGILLIETDHPGWKQILQTKQTKLLNDFRIRFPDIDISGISLILGKMNPQEKANSQFSEELKPAREQIIEKKDTSKSDVEEISVAENLTGYDAIMDKDFRDKLIKLGQSIEDSEKK